MTTNHPLDGEVDVDQFEEHGWAVLPSLLDADTASALASAADGLRRTRSKGGRADAYLGDRRGADFERVHIEIDDPAQEHERFGDVARSARLGRLAARLLGVPRVRLFKDLLLIKPGAPDTLATPIHQDMPFWPFDRSAALTFWIALQPVTPDMGSLRFFDGSHRWGLLGSHLPPSEPLEDRDERLHATEPTAPHRLDPGDATVHMSMTVHTAAPNHTDQDRWAWVVSYVDADVVYTGAAHRVTDPLGLKPNSTLDHSRFPLTAV